MKATLEVIRYIDVFLWGMAAGCVLMIGIFLATEDPSETG